MRHFVKSTGVRLTPFHSPFFDQKRCDFEHFRFEPGDVIPEGKSGIVIGQSGDDRGCRFMPVQGIQETGLEGGQFKILVMHARR